MSRIIEGWKGQVGITTFQEAVLKVLPPNEAERGMTAHEVAEAVGHKPVADALKALSRKGLASASSDQPRLWWRAWGLTL